MVEFVAGLILGGFIGYLAQSLRRPQTGPRIYSVSITPTDRVYLRFVGTLDERKAKALANHVLDGGPFTGLALERRNGGFGFLSHREFVGVREDLINRGAAWRKPNRTVELKPPAFALFRSIAGRRGKQANSNNDLSKWKRI